MFVGAEFSMEVGAAIWFGMFVVCVCLFCFVWIAGISFYNGRHLDENYGGRANQDE